MSVPQIEMEKFICEECGHHEDADVDAAKVILQRGLDGLGIYLDAVPRVPRKQVDILPTLRLGTACLGL
jgi:transposase